MTTNPTTLTDRLRLAVQANPPVARLLARWGRLPAPLRAGLLCLAAILIADALIIDERGLSGDDANYERMAQDPTAAHNVPYAFRIAVPWLVHVLPFSHTFSFSLLAWLATAAAGGALYALMRQLGASHRLALALAVGFALSPPLLVVSLRQGRNVDAASVLALALGSLFILRRQRLALAVTLLIGVFVRESSLFLIPFAYAYWARRPVDLEALRDTAAVVVLPVIAYVVLRASITAVGQSYEPGYSGPFFHARLQMLRNGVRGGGWHLEVRRLAAAFGPVWLAAPFALRRLKFAQAGLALVLLCVAAMTYALDWGRVIFLAAPVFYGAAAYVVRHRRLAAGLVVAGLLALDVGYGVYMQVHGVRHGIDATSPPTRPIP